MYPNLKAELGRRGVTTTKLAEVLDVTIPTMSMKMNGKTPITLKEAKMIKDYLETDVPLEVLFEEAG